MITITKGKKTPNSKKESIIVTNCDKDLAKKVTSEVYTYLTKYISGDYSYDALEPCKDNILFDSDGIIASDESLKLFISKVPTIKRIIREFQSKTGYIPTKLNISSAPVDAEKSEKGVAV